jgi:basic membrane lipoprotein Med (substrate-binding protein (PBP1-ABC) superfamily)
MDPSFTRQHYDLRLTAEDGYQAQRSYSIASPPEQTGQIALTIEMMRREKYRLICTKGLLRVIRWKCGGPSAAILSGGMR